MASIGVWETDEIVERDQARIVVSVFEVKCLRQRVEQVGFTRA